MRTGHRNLGATHAGRAARDSRLSSGGRLWGGSVTWRSRAVCGGPHSAPETAPGRLGGSTQRLGDVRRRRLGGVPARPSRVNWRHYSGGRAAAVPATASPPPRRRRAEAPFPMRAQVRTKSRRRRSTTFSGRSDITLLASGTGVHARGLTQDAVLSDNAGRRDVARLKGKVIKSTEPVCWNVCLSQVALGNFCCFQFSWYLHT